MGILEQRNQQITLSARNTVGRTPDSTVCISDRRVSGRHAQLVWSRKGWQLRDLGSTNGTMLDGQRLEAGQYHLLQEGAVLAFGDAANQWVLVDASAPRAVATNAAGVRRAAEGGLLALPDDEDPQVVIFEDEPGSWVAEVDGIPRTVVDQEVLSVSEDVWRLSLPLVYEETWAEPGMDPSRLGLRFEVSRDEEFIRLSLLNRGAITELPARAHHYMLLLLARARLSDLEEGLSPGEAGWLYAEQLCQMLRTDQHQLNVAVHRARRQFSGLDVVGAGRLIERRRLTRQLRIGVEQLVVAPLQ